MKFVLFLIMMIVSPLSAQAADTVVLLHGIARTGESLTPIGKALQANGYDAIALTYPSTKKDLMGIAEALRQSSLNDEFWRKSDQVHFVTHSMGGLVIQTYLDRYRDDIPPGKLGRVVMLAPPNGGSEIADLLHNVWPYKWYYGPAGQELTTKARQQATVKPYYDLGIIAGTKEWTYVLAAFVVPGASDGRVSVKKTKMAGMKDHVTVPATHTFIMDRPDVHAQILAFLKDGLFTRK